MKLTQITMDQATDIISLSIFAVMLRSNQGKPPLIKQKFKFLVKAYKCFQKFRWLRKILCQTSQQH